MRQRLNDGTLATDRVRYVGDPVAMVVADTSQQAKDAAEAVFVDIDQLPAVTTADAAAAPDAPSCMTTHPAMSAWISITATVKRSPPPSPPPRT